MARGTDGCGVPTYWMTVSQVALAFARLADGSDLPSSRRDAARRLTGAMTAHPVLVSGTGRFNAVLMETLGDRLFAKTGAEAVFGVGLLDRGWGIGVKIEDGNSRGMGAVVLDTLRQLELVTASELEALAGQHHPTLRNHEGRVVGEIRPIFALEKVS
jgi:L-asparaginase II